MTDLKAAAAAVLFAAGCYGLILTGLEAAVGRINPRRVPAPDPDDPDLFLKAGTLAGALVGLGLWAAGVGGIWPFWAGAVGALAGRGYDWWRKGLESRRRRRALLVLLEELALRIPAAGFSLELALRAAAEGPGPARAALKAALAEAAHRGPTAVLEAWARRFEPETLGPVVAAMRAAVDAGLSPGEALRRTAETAAGELMDQARAELKTLPDALIPVLGLFIFVPILGLTMIPLLIAIINYIATTTRLPLT